jgi:hypothetical protein
MSEQDSIDDDLFIECKEKEQEKQLAFLIEHCEDFVLEDE